ncbi:hypothetical protein C8F01DRAFT_1252224 [Mycena amicta]|nr:hypothetical protein C8F01DRAFT_1252224 [Mycena amicta]
MSTRSTASNSSRSTSAAAMDAMAWRIARLEAALASLGLVADEEQLTAEVHEAASGTRPSIPPQAANHTTPSVAPQPYLETGCPPTPPSPTPPSSASTSDSSSLSSLSATTPSTPVPARTGPVYAYQSPSRPLTLTPRWAEALHQTQGVGGSHVQKIVDALAPKKKSLAYVVFRGWDTGVFLKSQGQWPNVQAAVTNFAGAVQQGYTSESSARTTWKHYHTLGYTSQDPQSGLAIALESMPTPLPLDFASIPTERLAGQAPDDSWYVVVHGVQPGVYPMFLEMALHTNGISMNGYHKTDTFEDAVAKFRAAEANGETEVRHTPKAVGVQLT